MINFKSHIFLDLSYVKTNKLLEGFFKIIFPKKYKRIFRTEKGVKNYSRQMRI